MRIYNYKQTTMTLIPVDTINKLELENDEIYNPITIVNAIKINRL